MEAISCFGGSREPSEAFYVSLRKEGPERILRLLGNDGDSIKECSLLKEKIYKERFASADVQLASGFEALMENPSVKSVAKRLVTNADDSLADLYFERFRLERWFNREESVVGNNEGNIRPKPAPDLYLEALRLSNVQKESVLVFEDSMTGISAAMKAGIERIILITEESGENCESMKNITTQKSLLSGRGISVVNNYGDIKLFD